MGAASFASAKFRQLLGSMGRPALGALFPSEFEVYMLMLELIDSDGKVADYLSFPVMPSDITKTEPEITNIKKTYGGVISTISNSFTPQDITISGDFGRAFKVLVGREIIDFKAFGKSIKKGIKEKKNPFNVRIKTGYGCTKLLQSILTKSTNSDSNGRPYRLFLHNPALGESYLVEKTSLSLRQNKETSNMIWNYDISFKILGNGSDLVSSGEQSSLLKQLGTGLAQKGLNTLAKNAKKAVVKEASAAIVVVEGKIKEVIDELGGNINT